MGISAGSCLSEVGGSRARGGGGGRGEQQGGAAEATKQGGDEASTRWRARVALLSCPARSARPPTLSHSLTKASPPPPPHTHTQTTSPWPTSAPAPPFARVRDTKKREASLTTPRRNIMELRRADGALIGVVVASYFLVSEHSTARGAAQGRGTLTKRGGPSARTTLPLRRSPALSRRRTLIAHRRPSPPTRPRSRPSGSLSPPPLHTDRPPAELFSA
jgi:hypothetical protein